MILTIIVLLFTLLVLILSHEFGHFVAAKKFGIRVLEFGFGLPPRIWGKKKHGTIYSVNALPIGGFVRLEGEDEVDPKILQNQRSFAAKPVLQRVIVVVAGVLMNLFLAVILFSVVLFAQGFKEELPLLYPHQFAGVKQEDIATILIGQVARGSPAEKAGLKSGDRITAFNGTLLQTDRQLIDLAKQYAGEKISLTAEDENNQTRQVEIIPRKNPPSGQGPLGIELFSLTVARLTYPRLDQKILAGFIHSYNFVIYSGDILGQLISQSVRTHNIEPVSASLAGPVGITNITGIILQTKSPLLPFLNFVGMLALNLAVVNILPIPALDGGRLVFLLIEGITGRRVKAQVEKWIHTAGMAFLIGLIILITISDIRKLFS